jgi:hypothetical protein
MARSLTAAPTLLHSVSRLSTSPSRMVKTRSSAVSASVSGARLPLLVSSPSSWSNWKGPNETMRCGSPDGLAGARLRFRTFWMRNKSSRGSKGLPR